MHRNIASYTSALISSPAETDDILHSLAILFLSTEVLRHAYSFRVTIGKLSSGVQRSKIKVRVSRSHNIRMFQCPVVTSTQLDDRIGELCDLYQAKPLLSMCLFV